MYKAIKRIYLIQYLNKRRNKKMAVPLKTPKMYFFQHANWLRKTTELSFVKLNLYFECLCKICVKVTLYECVFEGELVSYTNNNLQWHTASRRRLSSSSCLISDPQYAQSQCLYPVLPPPPALTTYKYFTEG